MRPRRLAIKGLHGFLKIRSFGSGYARLGYSGLDPDLRPRMRRKQWGRKKERA
jgi:hypothetical protein